MADNYLEKKYEEYLHGKSVIRRVNPSLDSLLDRISGPQERTDPGYAVKQAQLDAIVRTAGKAGFDATLSTDEKSGRIELQCSSPEGLGALVLAARLKAAELGLHTEEVLRTGEGLAEIKVFR